MRHRTSRVPFVFVVFAVLALSPPSFSQGREYFNVESPQVHAIEVARIGGHDYLLICNTPDNSVEIWDTDESLAPEARFIARLPVGLEPVSVRWVPELARMFVANFLGDSISVYELAATQGGVRSSFVSTVQVTDEPLDMAFANLPGSSGVDPPLLIVTHKALDAIGKYNALTLQPIATGSERIDAAVDTGEDIDFDGEVDEIALKEPRAAAVACAGQTLFVLGQKGGNTIRYDFDLYREGLVTGERRAFGGLGSTNANMAFDGAGNLYVVAGKALNGILRNEQEVAAAQTGFVESMFYMIQDPCGDSPTIRGRDVNLRRFVIQPHELEPIEVTQAQASESVGGPVPVPLVGPVPKSQALAQPTDVLPFERQGSATKVFFTAFSSDRIGVIVPSVSGSPLNWTIRRIAVTPLFAPMAGPRALALKPANTLDIGGSIGFVADRLYVLNRIDNSVTIIDPVAESVLGGFRLNADPTPAHITEGRQFLYDARLSGRGFVSCSSCHIDGRTDALAWDLGDGVPGVPIPPNVNGSIGFDFFPADKEFMVTQSLQGLLNWEVPQESQKLFTNAPYHWRGDRATFLDFNGAFASLLAGSELADEDMGKYEEFINSIHYPPNPKQPRERTLSGDLGDPDDNDMSGGDTSGEDAQLGMKLFHLFPGDTCAPCHSLPNGSGTVLTLNFPSAPPHPVMDPPIPVVGNQPIETPALRHTVQKEARLDRDGSARHEDSPVTGYEGLMHAGAFPSSGTSLDFNGGASFNAFNRLFFTGVCGGAGTDCKNVRALNQFLHEFDTGSSPMIGRTETITLSGVSSSDTQKVFDAVEEQAAEVNSGVAVHLFGAAGRRGFWFDQSRLARLYREEPTQQIFTRAQLLGLLQTSRDRLVVMAVPLGSERRVAHPDGTPAALAGPVPSGVELRPMVPNSAYERVPEMSLLWATTPFGGTHTHTIRLFQHALLLDGPPGGFGLCSIRHEAPRRFRVAGRNIRHGAELHLFVQDDPDNGPPNLALGPQDQPEGQVQTLRIVLPIHPTGEFDLARGVRIWETAAEMENRLFYRLMAGRPDQDQFPGIMVNLTDRDHLSSPDIPEGQAGIFDPVAWNRHWVRVVNEDGTQADGGWVPLTIDPAPDCLAGPDPDPDPDPDAIEQVGEGGMSSMAL